MPRGVWLSNAAVQDLERIREWLAQPGAGIVAAT
jgi:plasmid stabilization system protein ParE